MWPEETTRSLTRIVRRIGFSGVAIAALSIAVAFVGLRDSAPKDSLANETKDVQLEQSVSTGSASSPRKYSFYVVPQGGDAANTSVKSVGVRIVNEGSQAFVVFVGMVDLNLGTMRTDAQQREDLLPGESSLMTFYAWVPGACYAPMLLFPETEVGLRNLENMASTRTTQDWGTLTASGDISAVHTGTGEVCVRR
jgi:hypothetical protein